MNLYESIKNNLKEEEEFPYNQWVIVHKDGTLTLQTFWELFENISIEDACKEAEDQLDNIYMDEDQELLPLASGLEQFMQELKDNINDYTPEEKYDIESDYDILD